MGYCDSLKAYQTAAVLRIDVRLAGCWQVIAVHHEVSLLNETGEPIHPKRLDLASGSYGPHHLQSLLHVQLTGTAIVIQAEGNVGGLLSLKQNHPRTDGVYRPRVNEDHIAALYRNPIDERVEVAA